MQRAMTALVLLVLTGCGVGADSPDFVFLVGAEPETIDPSLLSGEPGGRVALNIFEGLTYRDARTLAPRPGMAESWDLSSDGLTYVFHLRPRATWSDGRPVTAGDFVFGWTRTLDPDTAGKYASMLYPIENAEAFNRGEITDPTAVGVHALDDHTLEVKLHSPCAYFLDLCAFYPLLPQPRHVVEAYGENWIKTEHLVSNGAYLLEEWLLSRHLRFRKNPDYWNADSVQTEHILGITAENINANFNLYMSGVLDWADASAVPLFVVPELKKRPDFHVAPYFCTYFYRFNTTRPPLDDARVRKALFLALNSSDIVNYVTKAGQTPAHSLVPPGLPGYTEIQLSQYNPEEARSLLAEAGYPNGKGFPSIEILFNTSESHKQIAEVVQQQWKKNLNIDVKLVNQEWKVFLATEQSMDFWITRGSWIGDYLDPNTFLDLWTSTNRNNRTGYANPEYDRLIDTAARTVDPEARMDLLHRAEALAVQRDMVILPVYYYVVQDLYDPRDFNGLAPNLINFIDLKSVRPLRGHRGRPRDRNLAAS